MTDMNVALRLRAFDQASPVLRGLTSRLGVLGAAAQRFSGATGFGAIAAASQAMAQQLGGVAEAAGKMSGRLSMLGLGAGGLFVGVAKSVVDTGAQFERFRMQLTALEGSSAGAEKALGWATKFANDTELTLPQVIESYAQLRTFGLDPTAGSMQALADTAAAQGKGFEQVSGMALALGQAWTKTKLQGEEALQLIERGVPVWDMLAKATGKNAVELQTLSEKGALGRKEISLLIEQMGKASAGASLRLAGSWAGQVSALEDKWTGFKNMIAGSGLFDVLKGQLKELNDRFGAMAADGRLQVLAKDISDNMVAAFREAKLAFVEFWGVAQSVGRGVLAVKNYFGSWKPILAGIAAVMAGPLIGAMASLATAAIALGTAIGFTPLGLIATGLAAVAAGAVWVWKNWDWVSDTLQDRWGELKAQWKVFTDAFSNAFRAACDAISAAFSALVAKITPNMGLLSQGMRAGGAVARWVGLAPQMTPAPPITPALTASGAGAGKSTAEVTVKFENAPRGMSVTGGKASRGTSLNLDLGYAGLGTD